jgi:hypothetical protein
LKRQRVTMTRRGGREMDTRRRASGVLPMSRGEGREAYDFDTAAAALTSPVAAALMPHTTAAPRGWARGLAMERKRIRVGLVKKMLRRERERREEDKVKVGWWCTRAHVLVPSTISAVVL